MNCLLSTKTIGKGLKVGYQTNFYTYSHRRWGRDIVRSGAKPTVEKDMVSLFNGLRVMLTLNDSGN